MIKSDVDKFHDVMLRKVRRLILKKNLVDANTVGNASKILFSQKGEIELYYTKFEAFWKRKMYKEALKAYHKAGKPFWHAETVGRYYEKQGLIKEAMKEYEYLMTAYSKMGKDFLPLPGGPVELFKLGRWYISSNPKKAKRYLTLYLRAEEDNSGTGRGIRHKKQAERLLKELREL
ncbi:MAG: hypothetical protein P9L88_04675 [Candidatus Tantalella remota]|nr:hypothetical protein [Candidatus Tantalella remota]